MKFIRQRMRIIVLHPLFYYIVGIKHSLVILYSKKINSKDNFAKSVSSVELHGILHKLFGHI